MYTLLDIDLAAHRRDVSHEPRDSQGRWTRGGAHLSITGETRWDIEERDAREIAKSVEALTAKVADMKPGTTEYEHTWAQIGSRVEALSKHAKRASTTHERVGLKLKDAPASVKGAHHLTKETAEVAATTQLGLLAINAGASVAAVSGSIMGGEQAQHFSEAFNHFAENPLVEAGIIAAVALLLHALFVAIGKGLKGRRSKRIEKARGLRPATTA